MFVLNIACIMHRYFEIKCCVRRLTDDSEFKTRIWRDLYPIICAGSEKMIMNCQLGAVRMPTARFYCK